MPGATLTANPVVHDVFRALISACKAYGVPPEIVFYARAYRYRDKVSNQQRATVLRKLHADGWSPPQINLVCPMTPRGLRKLLRRRSAHCPSSKVKIRLRKPHGGIDLVSPRQLYRRGLGLPRRFTYRRTPRGIICKRVAYSKHPSY